MNALERSWGGRGASASELEAKGGHLGDSWRGLDAALGGLGMILGRSWIRFGGGLGVVSRWFRGSLVVVWG